MLFLKWFLYFCFALVLQATIISQIAIAGVYPNAVLILLFILTIEHGRFAGIWVGFFVGLIIDLYSGGTLGVNALANSILGGFVGLFSREKLNPGPVFQISILVIASLLHSFIYYSVETEGVSAVTILANGIPGALYTAILSSFILFAAHYLTPHRRR
ncbi:rod shape-determining protein MreD [Chitinivibrio alkaliphilus]|uniref:Rod shape-determining protein MreD n=1 Tax=Chitinivibrio alkaliphilus ACht1 TaxID=1313304 RepID=U7D9C1_9BACT|nr:rod shape-determining protein MreD [Chitinivibrio alkaliphilus]ERP38989.1 rod shape-determining protein MreD [Chitinivibrio alkaliphilus ACht1]